MLRIFVQAEDFDAGVELARLADEAAGGIASFIGTVRSGGELAALHLEHYPGMTERAITGIAEAAAARWPLQHCTVIHRFGRLLPGANIVFVGAASAHRQAALSATAFLIDWLKTAAPFWKREEFSSGASQWLTARPVDDMRAAMWAQEDKDAG